MYSFPYKPGQYEKIFAKRPTLREIHISDKRSFTDCRQRWHFSSPLRLGYVPNIPSHHLWLGRAVHYALAAYYSSQRLPRTGLLEAYHHYVATSILDMVEDWLGSGAVSQILTEINADPDLVDLVEWDATFQVLYEKQEDFPLPSTFYEEMPEAATLGADMLQYYLRWSPDADAAHQVDVIIPEISFSVPVPSMNGVAFAGTTDAVASTTQGVCLLEWKTCTNFPNFDALFYDEQAIAYVWGVRNDPRFRGFKPEGVLFTFLRKRVPKPPRVLKSGRLSQDKRQDTTYGLYLEAIRLLEHDIGDYAEMLDYLQEKPNNFIRRLLIPISQAKLDQFEKNLVSWAGDMLADDLVIYPSCNWYKYSRCAYRDPCGLAAIGQNPRPLLDADYNVRTLDPVEVVRDGH